MGAITRRRPSYDPNVTFLSAAQLAKRWGVHSITIWKWRKRGLLPSPEQVGPNVVRWRSDVIAAFEWARRESEQAK
jgi:predicted DNA-binding transcriptional regulator AlpA